MKSWKWSNINTKESLPSWLHYCGSWILGSRVGWKNQKSQFAWKYPMWVLKRSIFEPRSQRSNPNKNLSSSGWEIIKKFPKLGKILRVCIFGSFRTISWSDDCGSFFGLLRWNRFSNTLLLSTRKPTFRTTWILTYKGLSNIFKVISYRVPVWKWKVNQI